MITTNTILGRYIAWRFAKAIGYIFLFCSVLVYLIDVSELLRRTAELENVSIITIFILSAYRIPAILEQIIPFAVLFGAMGTLFVLARRLELVVARAAGVSAWQFLQPGIIVAAIFGLMATLLYNPLSVTLQNKANVLESEVFNKSAKRLLETKSALWLRKALPSEDVVVGAARTLNTGKTLIGVVIIRQAKSGKLIQRIDAGRAELNGDRWTLRDAIITAVGEDRRTLPTYVLRLDITAQDVEERFSRGRSNTIWSLSKIIQEAKTTGQHVYPQQLQFHTLLAQPLFFIAMVAIAATVSLKFIRSGSISSLVLSGLGAGFMLYILISLSSDLGSSGVVPPILAAWLPPLVGLLMSVTLLLYQEDG